MSGRQDPDATAGAGVESRPRTDADGAYYVGRGGGEIPDLDAAAPTLRPAELRRLNRRALWFLAGIVLLLVCAVAWLSSRALDRDTVAPAPRQQPVVIPELPRTPRVESPVASMSDSGTAPAGAALGIPLMPSLPVMPAGPDTATTVIDTAPSLRQRRSMAGMGSPGQDGRDPYVDAMLSGLPGTAAPSESAAARETMTSARPLRNASDLLVRGTYLRCVLETRIVTDIAGFTSCIVTDAVYSIDGARLLLPRGAKVLGRYEREPSGPRVAVVWDRIITPDGVDVTMSSPGVDNLGGAGHPGDFDAHWGSRIGSALLVSLISDAFKYVAAEEGPRTTTVGAGGVVVQNPYESTTARAIERLAHQALDVRRPPTVTIPQGEVVNIYVARDVDFSAVVRRP